MRHPQPAIASILFVFLAACSASPTGPTTHNLTVALSSETRAISDVDGPYGAVSMKKHAVALRIWPDGLDDGLADASIIVTNGGWNTLSISADDISISSPDGAIAVFGRREMLATLGEGDGPTLETSARDITTLSERQSSRAARAQDGSMGGSRQSGDIDGTAMDPVVADAVVRASASRRPASINSGGDSLDGRRSAIDAWYLDMPEIYPGDSASGGISFELPAESRDLELTVNLDGETYTFELQYFRQP